MTEIKIPLAREPQREAAPPVTAEHVPISVTSEIGRLRKIMVHRPGLEMDRMIPSMMEQLLFDDILYGEGARVEHDKFTDLLRLVCDEVLEAQVVLTETLQSAEVRASLVETLAFTEHLPDPIVAHLATLGPTELADVAVRGIEHPQVDYEWHTSPTNPYLMTPLANMFFVRDPLVTVGDGALLCSMAHPARRREPLLHKFCYAFHPRVGLPKDRFFYFDDLAMDTLRRRIQIPGLEGGDILVASEKMLIIGASERTSEVAVELLAETLRKATSMETVLMVLMPKQRAMMHLDTVFTFTSAHEALVYPPMFCDDGYQVLPVVKKDLRGPHVTSELKPSLVEALADEGMEIETIRCGGRDTIAQQREQWTDGANAFCLAPGVITLYERNVHTIEDLAKHGYAPVHIDDVLSGKSPLDLDGRHKYVVLLEGRELSRARGGPHCMTMPLVRDRIQG